ncbi:MAG TPA: hypothetical protein VG934_00655 [Candidatus Paceibacterota bacterium]|nr:hypothetical protein [Candidatus Paceibacterota bacterium]
MKSSTIIGIIVVLVIAAAAIYWLWGEQAQAPTTNNSAPLLAADAYPLYTGVAWGSVASATLEDLIGVEVTSQAATDITNIASTSQPFEDYYRQKLLAAGWSVDIARAAGGPGSDITVYSKGGDFIATQVSTDFKGTQPNEPVQCPCDVTLRVFSGSAQ